MWVYRFDRLGRDMPDLATVARTFRKLGIRLASVHEGEPELTRHRLMADLLLHGSPVPTLFDLLGHDENDIHRPPAHLRHYHRGHEAVA